MKKTLTTILMTSLCLLAALAFMLFKPQSVVKGQGQNDQQTEGQDYQEMESQEAEPVEVMRGYTFVLNGTEIAMDADMEEIAASLGEPDSYFEEPACAAQGISKIYTYGSCVITTYPEGEQDLVGNVSLKDDGMSTPEGVDLSGSREDIVAAYGEAQEESGRSLTYVKDGMKLQFILIGEHIGAIDYYSSKMN